MQAREVVIGVDGSVESRKAVIWAARDAVRRDAALRIVHVRHVHAYPVDPFFIAPIPDAVHEPNESSDALVSEAVALAAAAAPALDITAETPGGPAAWTLLEHAAEAQLLVIGGTRRGLLDRAVFGSVTTHAAAHARCPVVVVRGPQSSATDPALPTGPVVVGVDASASGRNAAEFAFEYAVARGLEVVAVQAWPSDALPQRIDDAVVTLERAHIGILTAVAPVSVHYPDVKLTPIAVLGNPVHALIEQSEFADLLVVGSRGLGRFEGMLLGSVSAALVHQATCTLAVVRPTHES